jgi:hypothetical protein
MTGSGPPAEYLQACRARLRPEDVGLGVYGDRRRVPGLRREEVAGLPGAAPPTTRAWNRGQSSNASREVVDGIARALQESPLTCGFGDAVDL